MKFDFSPLNEYEYLFGNDEATRSSNMKRNRPFQTLIDQYFDNQLIFSIAEMVNLNHSELGGVGEFHLYSKHESELTNKKILADYKDVIKKVQNKYKGIAWFSDWYSYPGYILINSNEVPLVNDSKNSKWRLQGELSEVPKSNEELNSYGSINQERLSESFIKEYLDFYAQTLCIDLGFSQYPHYAIIVKPIAVIKNDEVFKLGNLYLHFATTHEKDKMFYARFLNDFQTVWLKEKGMIIIKEIQRNAIAESENKIKIMLTHYPTFWGTASNKLQIPFGKSNIPLSKYFDAVFTDPVYKNKLQIEQDILINELIPLILYKKQWLKNNIQPSGSIENILGKKLKGNAQHNLFKDLNVVSIPKFIRLLSRRSVFLVARCIFGKTFPEAHYFLVEKDFNGKPKEELVKGRLLPYLNGYFIYSPEVGSDPYISSQVLYDRSSGEEKIFLSKCITKVHTLINDSSIEVFNSLCIENLKIPIG